MWKHKNFINLQLCATFKHFYDAGTIGTGAIKFRHYSQQEPSSGETWVLNETVALPSGNMSADFQSNNRYFATIGTGIMYSKNYLSYIDEYNDDTFVYRENTNTWVNQDGTDTTAYRTLIFDTSPTGDLLTWLQANGVKQGGAVTLIDFTIDDSPTTGQVQYQAEEGMTWQQFVNSSYNTNNSVTISTYDNYVRYKGRQISDVTKDNVIIANKIYKTNTGSSGGGID